ncbi:molybdopterin-dependent oxidoreductase [Caulobacter segnis]|uniref:nitrate reductase n=1 Tax=Caulobacter segnis TaxID=88688 RepID=UPI00240F0858|nr:nitrate reductase [Caulobacter segnis]MDG2522154.1 molybdopterin-dependent oxidoreductase [Caulobacter segnis]
MDGEGGPVRTTCPYCGVGCGLAVSPRDRLLKASGDAAHPANLGRLCSKGAALGSTVGLDGRLLHPSIGRRRASWKEAAGLVGQRFRETIDRHGPDAVGFYVSGQLLTEDYYAANKLMKGFIGSGNIDTNSRLCMASAVVAHKLAFGADLVPGCYEDLEIADLVVFSGHNAAWTHPVLYRRMEAAKACGQQHVVIDPRRTDTAEMADLHLALHPQTDVRLWNGLLADLIRRGAIDRGFINDHVNGLNEVEQALAQDDQSIASVAVDCGLKIADLERFYALFARTPRTVSLFSMGANQSAQGVAKGLAIINAHLATGRIGKPGACPFSITGQPNAMGGRETGGMATTLAAHMDFDEAARRRVKRFWGAPTIAATPGLKAVDMFEAAADGRIKALWIMATNPAVSLPDAHRVRQALKACPFVVVSDVMADTDTLAFADVALPALAWGEKDGTVTNSERRISRQRALFEAPGEARADWRIIADVAQAMGFADGFNWRSPAQIFREWARLTAYENDGRTLNLAGLTGMTPQSYDALEPVQWPVTAAGGTPRLFTDGRFETADGRGRMNPVRPRGPAREVCEVYPLALNTGRVRDHWHTLTRTGLAPELCRNEPEPFVELHPDDAAASGVCDGQLTRVQTRSGEAVVVARLTDRQTPGCAFMPMHWTSAYAASGRVNPLVAAAVDPRSGQPEFKHTPARVRPYRDTWRGFYIGRRPELSMSGDLIWRRITQDGCHLHEFAGRGDVREREALRRRLVEGAGRDVLRLEDASAGSLREAYLNEGRLDRVFFATTGGRLPPREWLTQLFEKPCLDDLDRLNLLIGRAPGQPHSNSPVVCACRGVRADKIVAAARAGARDVDTVADATAAGSACGSCRPQIARILKETLVMANQDAA